MVAATSREPETPRKLTVSFGNISGDSLSLWAAKEGGYFAKNGLDVDVQLVSGGPNALSSLLSGQMQLAHLGGSEILSATAAGASLVIIATLGPVYPYRFYVAPNIKTTDDLKGKKVDATNFGSSVDVASRVGLRKLGLDPEQDVVWVTTGSHANGTAALLSGAIQGRMDNPPASQELEAKGFHSLFDLASLQLPAANNTVVVDRAYLDAHREVMQRYVDALVQATARAKKDAAFMIDVEKKYFKSDDDAAMQATYDYFIGEVAPSLPFPKSEQFDDALAELGKKNEKIRGVEISKILDPSFVQSAADRGVDRYE
jgi:ABC-type nitrate/sulfonate/bicarbonate transport system substrate-binding protein